jgi:hypothetical protein
VSFPQGYPQGYPEGYKPIALRVSLSVCQFVSFGLTHPHLRRGRWNSELGTAKCNQAVTAELDEICYIIYAKIKYQMANDKWQISKSANLQTCSWQFVAWQVCRFADLQI